MSAGRKPPPARAAAPLDLLTLVALLVAMLFHMSCSSSKTHGNETGDILTGRADMVPDVAGDRTADGITPEQSSSDILDDGRSLDVTQLIEEGKYWLANGEPGFALNSFDKAILIDPDNMDAVFGAGLSAYVRNVELFAMVLTLPTQMSAYGAGAGTFMKPESENDFLVEETHKIFMYLRKGFAEAEVHLKRIEDPGFSWTIEQVPVFVFTKPVINMRGRFDFADVNLVLSANSFLLWFTELLAAQDLHSDLLTIAYSAIELRDEGLDALSVLQLAAELMASDPRFFELHEDDGEFLFMEGSRHIRDTGFYLLQGLSLLEEGNADSQDVTWLEYDAGNPVLMLRNRVDFHSQEEEVVAIEVDTDLIARSEELLAAMDNPGEVVTFASGPVLQLGIVLGFANKLDLLRFLPVKIPIDVSDLEPAEIVALLSMFMGNSLGFDYGALFANPIGLRRILPLMVKVPDPGGPEDLWMEWECLGEIEDNAAPLAAGGFVCSKGAELTDSDHFASTPYAFNADGFASALPYMVWEDPTWGGFLAVDEAYLESKGDPPGFVIPDLKMTNLGVHLWLDPLLGLLR